MADPTLSDIDFKNKMAWVLTTLKYYWENSNGVYFIVTVGQNFFQKIEWH